MGRTWIPGLLAVMLGTACAHDRVAVDDLEQLRWELASGDTVAFEALRGQRATVFITLDPECPFSQAYTAVLDSLHRHFAPQGIAFVGSYPGAFFQAPDVRTFAARSGLAFPQVMDRDCALANALQARVTPEAFVIGPEGTLIYRGAIDDSAVRAGRKKPGAAKHYLRDVLQRMAEGEKGAVPEVAAVGCIVECR